MEKQSGAHDVLLTSRQGLDARPWWLLRGASRRLRPLMSSGGASERRRWPVGAVPPSAEGAIALDSPISRGGTSHVFCNTTLHADGRGAYGSLLWAHGARSPRRRDARPTNTYLLHRGRRGDMGLRAGRV